MGLEVKVVAAAARPLDAALTVLEQDGLPAVVAMVDGRLALFDAPPPHVWHEVRLRTGPGTVTIVKRAAEIAVVVFANADPALLDAQARVARALAG